MSHRFARVAVVSFVVVSFAAWLAARGKGPNSVQPDASAVFITVMVQHNSPPARGNILLLPAPNRPPTTTKPDNAGKGGGSGKGGGKGGGGGTVGGPSTINSGSTPYSAGPTYTPTTSQPEAEEEIAADPSDTAGNNLVAAISDFSSPSGYNFTKWVLSNNGGSSWAENFVPYDSGTGLLQTSDGVSWNANSDPVVAFDRSGNVYLTDLYINVDAYGRFTGEGFYVSVDTFSNLEGGNFSHTNPVLTHPHYGNTFSLEDKPWITVDNVSSGGQKGNAYVSWSHFTGCQNSYSPFIGYYLSCSSDVIDVAYSTDHGQSWSAPIQISAGTQSGAVQGSQAAVGPDGTVYVTYEFFGSSNQRQQYLAVGTWSAGSLSFSAPFIVTPVFNELTFAGCSTCTASYRVNSFPNIAVGPATGANPSGNVYLVYGGQASGTSEADVYFTACTAHCTAPSAFNSPVVINGTSVAAEHFFPAIAVDASGVIHTGWFDTRNSDNPITDPDIFDVYASFLTYTGSNAFTLSPNARVTGTSINANAAPGIGFGDTSFIGDYAGIAATAETKAAAHPVWTNASGILGIPLYGSLQTATLTQP
jgi:hypothetical protein